ncbi:hypothetical protein F1654_10235 [Alkalicaulis satelles]|uniref:Dihydrodipicolinate reductase n=1 Tax=Alkalicaulis satelles TaxID=2609175 RepID=A0A5M6ZBY0_9PROT|nr:hypothetical protein [Alkalicaulis satelles]KAA5802209.1 hypothetical protein F1654_10235 [Alkalicaulis satelles]
MKTVLFGAASALLLAAASFASPAGQVFEVTETNTAYTVSFDAEGGYVIETADGSATGVWTLEEGVLCLTAADTGENRCAPWTDLEVGQSDVTTDWSEDGAAISITRIE